MIFCNRALFQFWIRWNLEKIKSSDLFAKEENFLTILFDICQTITLLTMSLKPHMSHIVMSHTFIIAAINNNWCIPPCNIHYYDTRLYSVNHFFFINLVLVCQEYAYNSLKYLYPNNSKLTENTRVCWITDNNSWLVRPPITQSHQYVC